MQKILPFNFGEILWFKKICFHLDFASSKKWIYICPIFLAIIGVIFSVIPYVILGRIVVKLLEKKQKIVFST